MSQQTRRTGEQLLDAIADAVLSEIKAVGYQGVTYEGVARRAQTSKPVLYRRFPTRPEMVYAAIARRATFQLASHNFPTLRENLIATLRLVRANVDELGIDTSMGLIAESTPELRAKISGSAFSPALQAIGHHVASAVERGELPCPITSERLIRLPFSCLMIELLSQGTASDDTIEDIVDTIVLPTYRAVPTEQPDAPQSSN
ncbi:TetR/AcrR family transcriptional regulator [Corynebacterium kalinowskii]|nr:TetR/AcrR family transcriptional regulator [Corynebacterium kalinowskii]